MQLLPRQDARGSILGYYISYRIVDEEAFTTNITVPGGMTTSHLVTSLEKNTEYEFVIQAFNEKGVGPLSDPGPKIRTDEDGNTCYFLFPLIRPGNMMFVLEI